MTGPKRPSTSSLRRFINSRPYITVSEIRRRFGLDGPVAVTRIPRKGTTAFIGLPEREALKLCELWQHGEIGFELSVEVRAPAVVGIYPMTVARYVHHGAPPVRAARDSERPPTPPREVPRDPARESAGQARDGAPS